MQINFLGTKVNTLFYNDSHGSIAYIDSFLNAQKISIKTTNQQQT